MRCDVFIMFSVTRLLPSLGRLRLGLIHDRISPSPRLSSAFSRGVPFGLVVHPSMAVPTHHSGTSSDDGVGTCALFFGSRVRLRPDWGRRGTPRGSTRPSGTCLASIRLSSVDCGYRGSRRPSVEFHPLLEDLVDTPQQHPSHNQTAHFRTTPFFHALICMFIPRKLPRPHSRLYQIMPQV